MINIAMSSLIVLSVLVCWASADFLEQSYSTTVIPSASEGLHFVTLTSTTTRTHTIRKSSTSDVRITSAIVVPLTVTQYETKREYVKDSPDTVTSFIRLTKSEIVIETTTIEKFPIRTFVSTFTQFKTITSTVDLWHPITHYETSFEIVRLPVQETQTLIQVLYETKTVYTTTVATSTRKLYGYGF